jgi:hypothetical protein
MLNFGSFYVSVNVSNDSEDGIMTGNIMVRIIRSVCAATGKTHLSFHGRPLKFQPG